MSRRIWLTRVVRDMLPGGLTPTATRVACYLTLITVVCLLIRPAWFDAGSETMSDDHAILSIEIAMARTFCHKESAVSRTVRTPYEVRDNASLRFTPLKELAVRRAGSLDAYCQSVQVPLLNNENSLMWVESWVLFFRPDASVAGLGRILHGLRIVGLLFFCGMALHEGYGLLAAGTSLLWSLALLHDLEPQVYSAYPFLPVLLMVTAAIYAIASQRAWAGTVVTAAVGGMLAGGWTAFAANLRTSHLPAYVILACACAMVGLRRQSMRSGRAGWWRGRGAAALVAFVIGYGAFDYIAIRRHLPPSTTNLPRHTVAHPLVLALGVPENDLSRREGIKWSDQAALDVARRMEPGVPYLGPRYERVLIAYYWGLWRTQPREMARVYGLKARVAGKQMLEVLRGREGREGSVLRVVLTPLNLLPNGVYLLIVYIAVVGITAVLSWRDRRGASLMLYLSLAAVLLHIETVAIMSAYVVNYQAYLAFYVVWLSVTATAGAGMAAWRISTNQAGEPARYGG